MPEGPKPGKIYFSENQAPDLLQEGADTIRRTADIYNKSIRSNAMANLKSSNASTEEAVPSPTPELTELVGTNEVINELFASAREGAELTADLSECLI